MSKVTRTQLARAFVSLLGRFPTKQLAQALAELVIEQRLANQVDLLLKDIAKQLLSQKGQLDVKVESTFELSREVWRELERIFRGGMAQNVNFDHAINKNLLGGVIAATAETELDLSNINKLKRLG